MIETLKITRGQSPPPVLVTTAIATKIAIPAESPVEFSLARVLYVQLKMTAGS